MPKHSSPRLQQETIRTTDSNVFLLVKAQRIVFIRELTFFLGSDLPKFSFFKLTR